MRCTKGVDFGRCPAAPVGWDGWDGIPLEELKFWNMDQHGSANFGPREHEKIETSII
jgi:hypothetical protein